MNERGDFIKNKKLTSLGNDLAEAKLQQNQEVLPRLN